MHVVFILYERKKKKTSISSVSSHTQIHPFFMYIHLKQLHRLTHAVVPLQLQGRAAKYIRTHTRKFERKAVNTFEAGMRLYAHYREKGWEVGLVPTTYRAGKEIFASCWEFIGGNLCYYDSTRHPSRKKERENVLRSGTGMYNLLYYIIIHVDRLVRVKRKKSTGFNDELYILFPCRKYAKLCEETKKKKNKNKEVISFILTKDCDFFFFLFFLSFSTLTFFKIVAFPFKEQNRNMQK